MFHFLSAQSGKIGPPVLVNAKGDECRFQAFVKLTCRLKCANLKKLLLALEGHIISFFINTYKHAVKVTTAAKHNNAEGKKQKKKEKKKFYQRAIENLQYFDTFVAS